MFTAYEDGKSDREKGYVLAMPPAEPRKMKYQKTKQHETYHYLPNLTVTQSYAATEVLKQHQAWHCASCVLYIALVL